MSGGGASGGGSQISAYMNQGVPVLPSGFGSGVAMPNAGPPNMLSASELSPLIPTAGGLSSIQNYVESLYGGRIPNSFGGPGATFPNPSMNNGPPQPVASSAQTPPQQGFHTTNPGISNAPNNPPPTSTFGPGPIPLDPQSGQGGTPLPGPNSFGASQFPPSQNPGYYSDVQNLMSGKGPARA